MMSAPGFSAEASLYRPTSQYRMAGIATLMSGRTSSLSRVVPAQGFCECQSVGPFDCHVSWNSCGDGYRPRCFCSWFGSNGCQCVRN